MGIRLGNGPEKPALVYDQVYLTKLEIEQFITTDDTQYPRYSVRIEYRLFGVHENVRHFHPETCEAWLPDFVAKAQELAAKGDMSFFVALQSIESVVASVIQNDRNTSTELI